MGNKHKAQRDYAKAERERLERERAADELFLKRREQREAKVEPVRFGAAPIVRTMKPEQGRDK